MRKSLHNAGNSKSFKTRSLIEEPVLFYLKNACDNDTIKHLSSKRYNSLRCYCKTFYFNDTRLSEFTKVNWLHLMKEDGYNGADIDENEGKYSVWRYE